MDRNQNQEKGNPELFKLRKKNRFGCAATTFMCSFKMKKLKNKHVFVSVKRFFTTTFPLASYF